MTNPGPRSNFSQRSCFLGADQKIHCPWKWNCRPFVRACVLDNYFVLSVKFEDQLTLNLTFKLPIGWHPCKHQAFCLHQLWSGCWTTVRKRNWLRLRLACRYHETMHALKFYMFISVPAQLYQQCRQPRESGWETDFEQCSSTQAAQLFVWNESGARETAHWY